MQRRRVLKATTITCAALLSRPLLASRQAALQAFAGDAPLQAGRIALYLPALAENGHSVGLSVSLQQTQDYRPLRLSILSLRNPEAVLAEFSFGPLAITDQLETRIRLARSQPVTAVAEYSDGSYWQHSADVVVTQAACVEGLI